MRLIDGEVLEKEGWHLQRNRYGENSVWIERMDLKDVPTQNIEPQHVESVGMRWIPVSERLPDDLQEVNVTWVNRNPASYYADIKDKPFTATAVYYGGCWYWYSATCTDILGEYGENDIGLIANGIEITAWQPLPEPYKEKE